MQRVHREADPIQGRVSMPIVQGGSGNFQELSLVLCTCGDSDIFIFVSTDEETEAQKDAVVSQAHTIRKGKNLETNLDF